MIRGQNIFFWIMHKNPQELIIEHGNYESVIDKYHHFRMPVIRGVTNLFKSITLSIKSFLGSSETPEVKFNKPSGNDKKTFMHLLEKLYTLLSLSMPLVIIPGLCMFVSMWIFSNIIQNSSILVFNILSKVFTVILYLAYLYIPSKWGVSTLDNPNSDSTHHLQCGRSFLFLAGFISILIFSIIDFSYICLFGQFPNVLIRFITYIFLISLVSGVSCEVLKLSNRYQNIPLVRTFIKPGNCLPKITPRIRDRDQLEITSLVLKAVL